MRLSSRARVGLAAAPASFASLIAWAAWAAAVPSGPPQPASLSARSTSLPEGGKSGKRLVITYSTEQNGYLTPCGCSSPMLGGIPRRATWIKSLEADDAVVRIDNGDLTEALGRQDELKAETIVEMLNAQDYGAINLGEKDFRLGVAYLQSLQARFKGTLLCGNVLKQDGAPLFGESTVMNRQVGGKPVKVAVAGVLSEQYEQPITALNPDLKVQPAEEALTRIAPALATAGDVRVLLFHGPKSEAVELAKKFPVFQLVVCAHEGDHPMEPVKVGDAMVVCPGQDGKYAERALFAEGAARVGDVKAVPLGPEFADDARMVQIKQAYLDRVTAENLLAKVPKIPLTDGEKFAGSDACAGCHADAYKVWKASGHAHALETLAKVKQDLDPECVQCHVVGLDRGTGFESREKTPGFSHVGCESCHGPAGKHAADPTAAGTKMKKLDQMACVGCHNPQNSPRFDFATYWPKVKH